MNQNNEQERLDDIIKLIRKKIKIAQFFGRLYFALNDWLYGISLTITILSPFAFALLIYFPDTVRSIGEISLILSFVGSAIAILRVTVKFGERGNFDLQKRIKYEYLLNKIIFKKITIDELIEQFKEYEISELDEPQPD